MSGSSISSGIVSPYFGNALWSSRYNWPHFVDALMRAMTADIPIVNICRAFLKFVVELAGVNVFIASHHGRENEYCENAFEVCHPHVIVFSDSEIKHATQEMTKSMRSTRVASRSTARRVMFFRREMMDRWRGQSRRRINFNYSDNIIELLTLMSSGEIRVSS